MKRTRRGIPNFIGPKTLAQLRRIQSCRKGGVLESVKPGHRFFIGPTMPREIQIKISGKNYSDTAEYKERRRKKEARRRSENREAVRQYAREYYHKTRSVRLAKGKATYQERANRDESVRIKSALRTRIAVALDRALAGKSGPTMELLGCDADTLKRHLESQFQSGMEWGNRGFRGWHIDHIVPCAAFDLTKPDHQRACFHYMNLRPLWGLENMSKNDTVTPDSIALILRSQETIETDIMPFYIHGQPEGPFV